jgi:hypothetical protein
MGKRVDGLRGMLMNHKYAKLHVSKFVPIRYIPAMYSIIPTMDSANPSMDSAIPTMDSAIPTMDFTTSNQYHL